MVRQQQRSEETRAKLLEAFRASLLTYGLEGTTTQQVLKEAGISKGGMYHHFESKAEIVEAIYVGESRAAIERAVASAAADQPAVDRLMAACICWTSEVQQPATAKLMFDIGPSALGMRRAKEIDDDFAQKHIKGLLEEAVEAGEIALEDITLSTVLLSALVAEAALYTLRTGKATEETLTASLEALISSWRC